MAGHRCRRGDEPGYRLRIEGAAFDRAAPRRDCGGNTKRTSRPKDDPKSARWEIAAERMKARRTDMVPLAPMARKLFSEAVSRRRIQRGRDRGVRLALPVSRYPCPTFYVAGLKRLIAGLRTDGADADLCGPCRITRQRRTTLGERSRLEWRRSEFPREDRMAVLAHKHDDVHSTHYDKYERLREKRIALAAWERQLSKDHPRGEGMKRDHDAEMSKLERQYVRGKKRALIGRPVCLCMLLAHGEESAGLGEESSL